MYNTYAIEVLSALFKLHETILRALLRMFSRRLDSAFTVVYINTMECIRMYKACVR